MKSKQLKLFSLKIDDNEKLQKLNNVILGVLELKVDRTLNKNYMCQKHEQGHR